MEWKDVIKDKRWSWLINKNVPENANFFYGVLSSRIYFSAHHPSRLPKSDNIIFFEKEKDAIDAGFRKYKRNGAIQEKTSMRHSDVVKKACEHIDRSKSEIQLKELASLVGMGAYHFHRIFRQYTGVTPKEYSKGKKINHIQNAIKNYTSITDAAYDLGFSSNSQFYKQSYRILGMSPGTYNAGGKNEKIHFAIGKCSLGAFIVAKSQKGICRIALHDDPEFLINEIQDAFPGAELIGGNAGFELVVAKIAGLIEQPGSVVDLPLDIRGTAFQQRVWRALQEVPAGETVNYSDIAKRLGMPQSFRAVANACGANSLAIAVPCHRVIRSDGSMGGYRWGLARKQKLINREKELLKEKDKKT